MSKPRRALLITGGAQRVGKAVSLYFAAQGYDVALHYRRSQAEAEKTAGEIRALGAACALLQADLADPTQYADLVARAYHHFPALSVLVNNASVFDAGRFMESDAALYEQEFRINTQAPIFLTQAFAKYVGRGAVVNMLDTKIVHHRHSHFFYLLSKKTLAQFTKMAAMELAPHVRVNAVCPGFLLPGGGWGDDYQQRLEPNLPLQKIATLDEVAKAVYSLCDNSSLTGQCIFVDGGEHLL
ncbi:MAG: SDR family oxidoreductase [Alphaproteobacteria bacterium]|nr:SDR family oxidoreductase [Alphaproteobacteria bacterium]